MTKVENTIFDFIKKHLSVILFLAVTALGILMRVPGLDFESVDFQAFLNPWWDTIRANGANGLSQQVGNYNIPYQILTYLLTLLPFKALHAYKFVSIIFDYALAISAGLIAFELTGRKKLFVPVLTYSIVLCSLAVVFNSAFWAQCDSIYVSFILLAIYFCMRNKNILCFVMLGLSLAFKLQVVFIIPAFLYYYVSTRKISFLHFLIIPAVDILLCAPALLFGRSFADIFLIYFQQTDYGHAITMNYPNIYALLCQDSAEGDYYLLKPLTIFLTFSVLGVVLAVVFKKGYDLSDPEKFLLTSIWTSFTCLMFLSSMHERYSYLLDVLLIVYAVIFKKRFFVAAAANLISLRGYGNFMFSGAIDLRLTAVFNIGLYAYITWIYLRDILASGGTKDGENKIKGEKPGKVRA